MPVHAFVFPGQGSQIVGMGRDLAAAFAPAREVFGEVDEVLRQKLSKLMFEGPGEALQLTENTQPALMAMSLAVLRVLEHEGGFKLADRAVLVAGHSLGEYSALCAAGCLTVADTARLLRLRGAAMQAAVPDGEGAMAALLGGHIQAFFGDASEVRGQVEAGEVRLLAVLAPERLPGQFASVPTAREQGTEVDWLIVRGFYGPPNMPDVAYEYWTAALRTLVADPRWAEARAGQGLFAFSSIGPEFEAMAKKRTAEYRALAKDAGLLQQAQ